MKPVTEWVGALEDAFRKLDLENEALKPSHSILSKNVLKYRDGDILFWNEKSLSLYCISLKSCLTDLKSSFCQELLWINRPKFEVNQLSLSPTGSHLTLFGPHGVQTLALPTLRGLHGLFKDGAKTITCSCNSVDEKYFVVSGTKVLSCKWHPGFSVPSVLFILTSNNCLRMYKTDDPRVPFQTIDLNTSLFSSKNVLGETFISFEFTDESTFCQNSETSALCWTMYLLVGNGQVCRCSVTYDGRGSFKHHLHGLLRMYPPAEDNYGCDACSILYINSNPPVLVIATSEGKLHHCLLLSAEGSETKAKKIGIEDGLDFDEESLYVYETVELELSLKTVRLDETLDDDVDPFSCTMQLYRDPLVKQRYHCCHLAGLYSIHLSWLHKFEELFADDNVNIDQLNRDERCIVEHVVCTKPLQSSPINPIIGFAQVADVLLGSKIVCLTVDFKTSVFPLLHCYRTSTFPLSIENSSNLLLKGERYREDIGEKISKILQKRSTNPIIRGSIVSMPQDGFKLLCRATQVFREEYIQKYDQVKVELEKNAFRHHKMKGHQDAEVEGLQRKCELMAKKKDVLLDKYREVFDRHNLLKDRLNVLCYYVEKPIPVISEKEEEMKEKLKEFQSVIQKHDKAMCQLKRKSECFLTELEESNSALNPGRDSCMQHKAESLHALLKKEGNEMTALKKELKIIQNMFGI